MNTITVPVFFITCQQSELSGVVLIHLIIHLTGDIYTGTVDGVIRERNSESWSLAKARRYFRNDEAISRVS